jgi:hypothetical protein
MKNQIPSRNPSKTIKDHNKDLQRLALGKNLSPALSNKLGEAAKRLDKDFLEEQAALVRDLIFDSLENRDDRSDALKQRSAWAAIDGIAMHLDATGFTPVFRQIAGKMFAKQSLADPVIVSLETELIQGFAGGKERAQKFGLGTSDLSTAMSIAEKYKSGKKGLAYLTSPKFTFRGAMAQACGRPDKLHEVHMAIGKWVPVVTFVANIVVLIIPVVGVPISIATIVAGVILALVAGC